MIFIAILSSKMSSANKKGSLLLTVLRDLTDSYDEEERKSQRKKLKDEQERAQAALNKVIGDHQDKLQSALEVYTKVDAKIRASQERVAFLKKRLNDCKVLLKCKQEDLRQLWVENVKYKQMLKLFDVIEKVKAVPAEVARFRSRKHYLHASDTLMYNIKLVNGKLSSVEALKDIRVELKNLKEGLFSEILEEINKHLYVRPKPKPKVVAEEKGSSHQMPPKRGTLGKHSRTLSRTIQMEHEASLRLAQLAAKTQSKDAVEEDLTLLDPEDNSAYYMDILVESLQNLGSIESALQEMKGERMDKELCSIVERIALHVIRNAEYSGWHQHKAKLLATLLEKSFDKFRAVVDAHSLVLLSFQRVKKSYSLSCELYTEAHVWNAIQQVLLGLLSESFSISDRTEVGIGTVIAEASDVPSFFQRRKWPTGKGKPVYFRFDQSDHVLSVRMRTEQDEGDKQEEESKGQYGSSPAIPHVCPPSIFNVTKTFSIICEFATEIEAALRLPHGENCQLRSTVVSFVEHKFMDDIKHNFQEQLEKAIGGDNVNKLVDTKQQKATGLSKRILACVVSVWHLVEQLKKLIGDLPVYSNKFLAIMTKLLEDFYHCMMHSYGSVVSTGIGHERCDIETVSKISARWCWEDETLQSVKSFHSWRQAFGRERQVDLETPLDGDASIYTQETEFLFKRLVDTVDVHSRDIVTEVSSLKKVALVHESVEWFSGMLFGLIQDITLKGVDSTTAVQTVPPNPLNELPETGMGRVDKSLDLLEKLSTIAHDYRMLAETSILMLHFEIRVHCFYYLARAVYKDKTPTPTVTDLGTDIEHLKKDIDRFESTCIQYLPEPKMKYIFDGLGHLLASIFIYSAGLVQPVSQSAIKKMCHYISSIHRVLASKTQSKEDELEKAKQFFELLHLNPQEFIKVIQEQGKVFTLTEYQRALTLIGRGQQRDVSGMITTLHSMFSEDAV